MSGNGEKSNFIAAQPLDMPAAEVVAAAKDAGIDITAGYVANVRVKMRKAAGVASPRVDRKGFVLSRNGKSVGEIVSEAKEAGFDLTDRFITITRQKAAAAKKLAREAKSRRGTVQGKKSVIADAAPNGKAKYDVAVNFITTSASDKDYATLFASARSIGFDTSIALLRALQSAPAA